jgi:L-arabinonolactonase
MSTGMSQKIEQSPNQQMMSNASALKSILTGPPETTAHLVWDLKCELGECCLYDDETDEIIFCDILGKRLHKLSLEDGATKSFELPKMMGSFALLEKGAKGYLCAWEDSFQIYDVESKKGLSAISQGEPVNPDGLPTRLNDGRCDRTGKNFICGGYYGDIKGKEMKVYKCTIGEGNTLLHTPLVDSIRVTNSLCFSPDGSAMYLADSPSKKIHKFDYVEGNISNKTEFHHQAVGVPDGSCVDAEGFVWNAIWRSGEGPSRVVRLDPSSGAEVYRVNVPDNTSQVSCCCFGGTELNILFITTAAEQRHDSEPQAGGLYAVKLPFKGLQESRLCLTR